MKFKTLLCVLVFVLMWESKGQNAHLTLLSKADSFFIKKKYTEAYPIYEKIYQDGWCSDAMLLKMAFIKEASDDLSLSIYYLHQYYTKTADKKILEKLQKMAKTHNLTGYELNDSTYFADLYFRYKNALMGGTLLFFILALGTILYAKKRKKNVVGLLVITCILGIFLGLLFNGFFEKQYALVWEEGVLMSDASAAAVPIDYVQKGHKIEISKKLDVWAQIQWKNNTAYIKNSKIKLLNP